MRNAAKTQTIQTMDDSIERLLAYLETSRDAARSSGEEALATQFETALNECLERYCLTKRAELAQRLKAEVMD